MYKVHKGLLPHLCIVELLKMKGVLQKCPTIQKDFDPPHPLLGCVFSARDFFVKDCRPSLLSDTLQQPSFTLQPPSVSKRHRLPCNRPPIVPPPRRKQHPYPSNTRRWFYHFLVNYHCLCRGGGFDEPAIAWLGFFCLIEKHRASMFDCCSDSLLNVMSDFLGKRNCSKRATSWEGWVGNGVPWSQACFLFHGSKCHRRPLKASLISYKGMASQNRLQDPPRNRT